MPGLHQLAHEDAEGKLRAVVEVPQGARVKTKWDAKLGAIALSRPLPLGLAYQLVSLRVLLPEVAHGDEGRGPAAGEACPAAAPFASSQRLTVDGDLVGQVGRLQDGGTGPWERNDRLITLLEGLDRWGELSDVRKLPKPMRDQIEKFFLDTTFFTDKRARSRGWAGPAAARRLIRQSVKAFEKGS